MCYFIEYSSGKQFDWAKYLAQTDSVAAPASLFLHLVSCYDDALCTL